MGLRCRIFFLTRLFQLSRGDSNAHAHSSYHDGAEHLFLHTH
jgi:hypothetical protein